MRRPRLRLVLGLTIPVLVLVLLLAAWAIDSSSADGSVPRNVTLADRDVGKLPEDDLAATVVDVAETFAATEVQVRTPDRTYRIPAGELGLQLDRDATIDEALDLDDDRSLLAQPFVWLASFLDERTVPLRFLLDDEQLDAALSGLAGSAEPTEPTVVATADGFGIVSGSAGRRVSPEGVGEQLVERAEDGVSPLIVTARVVDQEPVVTDAEAQSLADLLTANTASGLVVSAGGDPVTIPAGIVRGWLGATIDGDQIVATIDEEAVLASLTDALPDPTEPKDAGFTVEGGAVRLIPAVAGTACCAEGTAASVLEAITTGAGQVEVPLIVDEPGLTTEEAEALRIVEPVGTQVEWNGVTQDRSFTTYFTAGQPRSLNIRLIAEAVKGTLILPGERFSMNDVVGERTSAKGYVEAGAIEYGVLVQDVGGGVSQFATTMFNAVFHAGLPINVYQMHSQYFDRYPFGREATMGFPNPDLAWTNDTPHGILVWTSSTETSVTVTLYSTQHAVGRQTGQTTGRSGNCQTVSTQRTITYPDGSTATDSFNARYRDADETSC